MSDGLGIDARVLGVLIGLTVVAGGVGYVVAAQLDGGPMRAAAIPAPRPTLSPEAQDPSPLPAALPAVEVPAPTTTTQPTPPPDSPVPEPVPEEAAPAPQPVPEPEPEPPLTPAPTTPPATPSPPAPPPAPVPTRPRPNEDVGDPTPFRPEAASTPLAQFVVPDTEFPADTPAATAALRSAASRAPETGATAADVRFVQRLGERFAAARLPGRQAAIDRTLRLNAWWYARRRAPDARVLVRDPQGLIYSYRRGYGFQLNPVGTAGRWQSMNAGFSSAQLAGTMLEVGASDVRGGRQTMTWEYYDVPDEPRVIRPNVSGMAQARVAHLMADAYRESGDPRFAQAAADAVAALAVSVDAGGARSMVSYPLGVAPQPWYVERAYPGTNPWKGAALNGFMVAILELRASENALRTAPASAASHAAAAEARSLADDGAATLDHYLPLHDSKSWSYYGMLSAGRPWRSYLANATYHCYHVSLLRSLAPLYAEYRFESTADTWAGYATRTGITCPGGTPTG